MKRIALAFGLCILSSFVFAQDSDILVGMPKDPGVYLKSASGWIEMQFAPHAKTKTKGWIGASMSPFGRITSRDIYKGAHASAQLSDAKPVFYLRNIGKFGRDAQIIKLESKNDHREVLTQSVGALRSKSVGVEDKNILEVKVARLAPDVLSATPAEPLRPGEYLFQPEEGAAFDFGVAK